MLYKLIFSSFLLFVSAFITSCRMLPGSAMIPYICFDSNWRGGHTVSGWTFNNTLDGMEFKKDIKLGGCKQGKLNEAKFWSATAPFYDMSKRKQGNTMAFKFSTMLVEQKITVDTSIVLALNNQITQKTIQEKVYYEKNQDRFKDVKIDIGKVYGVNYGFCQVYTLELKDYQAPNKPKGIEYLIQKDANKICYQVFGNFEIILLSKSNRATANEVISFEELFKGIESFEDKTTFKDRNMKEAKPMRWYHTEIKKQ